MWIVALLLLGVIIAFHEFGHFVAAKASGVGVKEFALGMGPVLFWKRLGETVYSLRAIPLGGFCAMWGEPSMEAGATSENTEKEQVKRKRKLGFTPVYKTDWTPDQNYLAASRWKQLLISLAGPAANVLMALLAALILANLSGTRLGSPEIVALGPVTVAEEAGVQVGDIVVAVNGDTIPTQSRFSIYMSAHPELKQTGYTLTVRRPDDGKLYDFDLMPDAETGLVGITHRAMASNTPLGLKGAWDYMCDMSYSTVSALKMLIQGKLGLNDVSGVVGITATVTDALESAVTTQPDIDMIPHPLIANICSITVMICMSLAIMNMLPLPALDGGRAVLTLCEMVTRRRVPERTVVVINCVGMLILCGFMLVIMVSDMFKIIAGMMAG